MKKKILYLFILGLILILHLSYIPNDFTWLDHRDIESGSALVPLDSLGEILLTRFADTGFYRPLVALTESVDDAMYADWAPGFHLTNVLLHILVVVVVPLFLGMFFSLGFFEVLFIMLLVGIHPLGWLPVGAISYRAELLLAFFVMLTVFLHAKARTTKKEKQKSLFEFLTVISFFFGLLAKETAVFLIPALILFWEVKNRKHSSSLRGGEERATKQSRRGLPRFFQSLAMTFRNSLFLSEISVLVLYFFLRFQAVPEVWRIPDYGLSFSEALGTRIGVFSELLLQFIIPFKPDLSDAILIRHVDFPLVFGVFLVSISSLFIVKKTGKAFFLFCIMLLPALALIPVSRLGSSHYGYMALAGFAMIVVLLMRKRTFVKFFCFMWIIVMCYTTFISGSQFKNDLTLFSPEVKKDPNFSEGYFYLGNYYLLNDELRPAEEAYVKALKHDSKYIAYSEDASAMMNLALVKLKQGKKKEAKLLLEKALPFLDDEQRENAEAILRIL